MVDRYLEFVAGRALPNTLRAVAFDLKTFFTVVAKDPVEVVAADVFEFLAHQRGDRSVVRIADRESGVSARTIARRLSSVSGLYSYLIARGDPPVRTNPVPRGLSTRRPGNRRTRQVPLVRVPRTLGEGQRIEHQCQGDGDGRSDGAGWVAPMRGARAAVRRCADC